MKDLIFGTTIFIIAISIIIGLISLTNTATSVAISTKLIAPKPGVSCVIANQAESVAISCWKD